MGNKDFQLPEVEYPCALLRCSEWAAIKDMKYPDVPRSEHKDTPVCPKCCKEIEDEYNDRSN